MLFTVSISLDLCHCLCLGVSRYFSCLIIDFIVFFIIREYFFLIVYRCFFRVSRCSCCALDDFSFNFIELSLRLQTQISPTKLLHVLFFCCFNFCSYFYFICLYIFNLIYLRVWPRQLCRFSCLLWIAFLVFRDLAFKRVFVLLLSILLIFAPTFQLLSQWPSLCQLPMCLN